jgi:hypothetical protein
MKALWSCVLILASAAAFTFAAEEPKTAKEGEKNAQFERIKALEGTWMVKGGPGEHAAHSGTVTYKVTAGGSAVCETNFGGSDHEMVTMYYMQGDTLAMTHYCVLQNRPHMLAKKGSDPNKIAFACVEGEDPKLDASVHMHAATFTFVDADHLKAEWTMYKNGKADSTHSFELVRKPK